MYRIPKNGLRRLIIKILYRLEHGDIFSPTIRKIFKEYYKVEIGMYSHGGCFIPGQIDKFTKIGNYCSIAISARVMNRNHPMEYISTHGLFFNPVLGVCEDDKIEYIPLEIENDVWIGHNAIIMPNVKKICNGAVIAAGAVVNKDIPPYAVVVGNPARIVRFRFSERAIKRLIASKWWEKTLDEIKHDIEGYTQPYENLQSEDI